MFDDVVGSETNSTKAPATGTDKTTGNIAHNFVSATPASSSNHLLAVLFADGLAQTLGVDPLTGKFQRVACRNISSCSKHWSQGVLSRDIRMFLGTKIHYSGGFVGTYALFTSAVTLECSGNVFDYEGSHQSRNTFNET